jgi:hypothetical protein
LLKLKSDIVVIGIGTGIDIGNFVDPGNLDFDLVSDLKGVSASTPTPNPTRESDPKPD